MTPGHVSLYAVIPTHEALAQRTVLRGLRLVACGPVVAVVGKPAQEVQRAALRHDRVVGRALEACTSVVPFRLGIMLEPNAELPLVMKTNLPMLSRYLERFQGRVEMSLKVKLPDALLAAQPGGQPPRLPFNLARLHALAPESRDRMERVKRTSTARIFEGCYLILRRDIDLFWAAVRELEESCLKLPLLGSGPWAPYSFCDFALRPGR